MKHIKTAMERFKAYCESKGIPEKSSLAHIHKMSQFEEHERKELRAALDASQKENVKLEDELDEYKEHHEELTEHYKALQFLESEFRKENAEQAKRIAEAIAWIEILRDSLLGIGGFPTLKEELEAFLSAQKGTK